MISFTTISVYAEGGFGKEVEKTSKRYRDSDENPGGIDSLAMFIQLNLEHKDYVKLNEWVKNQNSTTQDLYNQWLPIRTVPFIENSEADKGTNGVFNIPLALWDGFNGTPTLKSGTDNIIDPNFFYEVKHSFEDIDLGVLYKNNQIELGTTGKNIILGSINLKAPEFGNSGTSYVHTVGGTNANTAKISGVFTILNNNYHVYSEIKSTNFD